MHSHSPNSSTRRFGSYFYALIRHPVDNGWRGITSTELGSIVTINPKQIRRDLSTIGKNGKRGVGYKAGVLLNVLRPAKPIRIRVVGDTPIANALRAGAKPFKVTGAIDVDFFAYGSCDLAVLAFKNPADALEALRIFRPFGVTRFLSFGDYEVVADWADIENASPMRLMIQRAFEIAG